MRRFIVPVVAFLAGVAATWTAGIVAEPSAATTSPRTMPGTRVAMVSAPGDAAKNPGEAASSRVAGKVVSARDAEHRVSPSGKARVTILARGRNAFTGILEMDGGAAVPEHQDASEEYIYVLEGGGTVTIDGVSHTVNAGDLIFMPGNARVSYQNGPRRMVAFQVFAGPESAKKYDGWKVENPRTSD